MTYCALLGDVEWLEDNLIEELANAMCKMAEKYDKITFLALPMCTLNGRVTEAINKVHELYPDASFVQCTFRYTADYISPGEPFDAIVIPPDINKIEDYYPYMCRWAIEKCESAIIYIAERSLIGRNHLSVNALKLAEYAEKLEKDLITVKPDIAEKKQPIEPEEIDLDELFDFGDEDEESIIAETEEFYPDFDYDA